MKINGTGSRCIGIDSIFTKNLTAYRVLYKVPANHALYEEGSRDF